MKLPTCNKNIKSKPSRVDGGWGWIIVISSFVVQMIIDGTISGYGILYLYAQTDEAFVKANYSRTLLSLPGTIQTGFFLCMGAFVSPLIQFFGFRIMGCFGAFLVGVGMATASFLTNIHAFNLFYGVISGSGFGILVVCAIVAVNYYFDRYRGVASGIAMSGSGIGCLTIPVLFNALIEIQDWRLTILYYSLGTFAILLIASFTFRPFIKKDDESEFEETKIESQQHSKTIVDGDEKEFVSNLKLKDSLNPNSCCLKSENLPSLTGSTDEIKRNSSNERKLSIGFSQILQQYFLTQSINPDLDNDTDSVIGSRLWKSSLGFKRTKLNDGDEMKANCKTMTKVPHHKLSYQPFVKDMNVHPFDKPDIYFCGSLSSLPYNKTNNSISERQSFRDSSTKQINKLITNAKSNINKCLNENDNNNNNNIHTHNNLIEKSLIGSNSSIRTYSVEIPLQKCKCNLDTLNETQTINNQYQPEPCNLNKNRLNKTNCINKFLNRIVTLFDLKLFTEPAFIYLLAIGITNQLAYFIPFVYLIDFSISKGIERNRAVIFVMILSILHTIGRIVAGIFVNVFHMDTVYLSGISTFVGGLAHLVLIYIFPPSFAWYSVYAAIYGISSGLPIPCIPLLLVRFIGLERLTASFSNLNFTKGIASVLGPIIAVSIVEYTGHKNHYFLVAGMCFTLSTLFHFGLCRYPCTKQWTNNFETEMEDPYAKCFCKSRNLSRK